jgi:hypothetical protein
MDLEMFSIRDDTVGAFHTPFFCHNMAEAVRAFEIMCKDKETVFGRMPADFTLYSIGTWMDDAGRFDQDQAAPVRVMGGIEASLPEPTIREVKSNA